MLNWSCSAPRAHPAVSEDTPICYTCGIPLASRGSWPEMPLNTLQRTGYCSTAKTDLTQNVSVPRLGKPASPRCAWKEGGLWRPRIRTYYLLKKSYDPYFKNTHLQTRQMPPICAFSNDNTFPSLHHTCSKQSFPFFTLEVDVMSSAQKSGVHRVGGAGCE